MFHKFEYWGQISRDERLAFYNGWTNGFLFAQEEKGLPLANCLVKVSYGQALAMVDKYYKDHPEKWSNPISVGVLEALTVKDGPCPGSFVPRSH